MVRKNSIKTGKVFTGCSCRLITAIIFFCIIATPLSSVAQHVDAFARVSINKRQVYVQQPIRATVTVYTATWFTQPLDFTSIQIPNAFIIPFSRTVPGVYHINGKQYSGLEFYYLIYPYKPGNYEIPPINLVAYTPAEGSSQGTKINLKTSPVKYTVKDVPAEIKTADWFVAKDVSLAERWSKPLTNLKVGDVVERTITLYARGTLPNFIPQLKMETQTGISIYNNDPQLIDQRNDQDVNGTRVEKVTYLFEKEGTITVPGVTIHWWDPVRQRMLTRKSEAVTINVQPNENLGILTSVRDSLATQQSVTAQTGKAKGPLLIFGMPWKRFVLVALIGVMALFFATKLLIRFAKWIRRKRHDYRQGEAYWFRRFMHSGNEPKEIIQNFYDWWNRLPGEPPALKNSNVSGEALEDWLTIEKAWIEKEKTAGTVSVFKKKMEIERKKIVHKEYTDEKTDKRQQAWVGTK